MKISSFPLPAKPILSAGAAAVVPSAFVSAAEVSAAVVAEGLSLGPLSRPACAGARRGCLHPASAGAAVEVC